MDNVSEIVAAFGGPTKTAAIFEVGASAVCNWKSRGRFPDRLHYRLAQEAERRGIAIDQSLFAA